MLKLLILALVSVSVYAKYSKFEQKIQIFEDFSLHRLKRNADRIDAANLTCIDLCLEELSNFTNGIHTNTSFTIVPGGRAIIKIDPVDFTKICPILGRTVSCIGKCKDAEAKTVLSSFALTKFACVDKFTEMQKHYKCIYENTDQNINVDICTNKCVEDLIAKEKKEGKSSNATTCDPLRCVSKCAEATVTKNCGADANKLVHASLKIQVENYKTHQEAIEGKKDWPKDCADLEKDLASDKPLS